MRRIPALCLVIAVSLVLLSAASLTVVAQEQPQNVASRMSNQDVLDLLKSGISTEIIIAKIKSSPGNYDTSATALKDLKAASVPDAVILAMVQAPTGSTAASVEDDDDQAATSADPKATVFVYRKKNWGTRNMQPSVYVDEAEVARIDDGRYFIVKLDPGKHKVEVNKGHSGAEIDMKPGRQYYFRVDYVPGFWKAHSKIDFVQREQGSLELQKLKPLEAKWVKDRDKVLLVTVTATK